MKRLAAIGMFDGVHNGHRALLDDLRRRAANAGMEPLVVTFKEHPLHLVNPGAAPGMLMNADVRCREIEKICGEGSVVMLDFTPELRLLTARQFMERLRDEHGVAAMYLGFNHRFGSDRLTRFADYAAQAQSLGMEAVLGREERGPQGCAISSSDIRKALEAGDVARAHAMLGRAYRLEGRVVAGKQIGRTIGFPTANVEPATEQRLVPAAGVYAAFATIEGGERYPAVVNIGRRPTIGDNERPTIEAHLLDFSGDIYSKTVALDFVERLRDEQRFASLDELRAQIGRDVERARVSVAR